MRTPVRHRFPRISYLLTSIVLTLLIVPTILAQSQITTGQIQGLVQDANGAVVPGVNVEGPQAAAGRRHPGRAARSRIRSCPVPGALRCLACHATRRGAVPSTGLPTVRSRRRSGTGTPWHLPRHTCPNEHYRILAEVLNSGLPSTAFKPDLQIRRFLCGHPDPFRSVRDLGLVSSLPVVQAGPEHPEVVHPFGSQRGSRRGRSHPQREPERPSALARRKHHHRGCHDLELAFVPEFLQDVVEHFHPGGHGGLADRLACRGHKSSLRNRGASRPV